ncbi:putative serine/threonine protein kinase [Trypanosoma conorhini]|uniref:Putative serine/threonine protein kinase n=1 Tax=Trypanosoma conorhini TaxID=83891 RepID=A0A3R7P0M5_9TRYP|nr:putative serine/threonine protein kinase [Trypanosoma conorhini]RNF26912.1 putative serine/threonine protein kinase [Trypanosoma conorhini]
MTSNSRPAVNSRPEAAHSSLPGLHIDLPNSPMRRSARGQRNLAAETEPSKKFPVIASAGNSAAASPLNAGELGKQMAATEASYKISSRALMNAKGLRNVRSISCMEMGAVESSPDASTKEMEGVYATLLDSRSPGEKEGLKTTGTGTRKKEASPDSVKRSPVLSSGSPVSPAAPRLEDAGEPNAISLEGMLREASKIYGIRLRWILYGAVLLTVIIFFLLLGEFHTLVKENVVVPEEETVEVALATAVNQLEWLQHSVGDTLRGFEVARGVSQDVLARALEFLCGTIGGAPLVFATYGGRMGAPLKEYYACPTSAAAQVKAPLSINAPQELPKGSPCMAVYSSDYIIAMTNSTAGSDVLAVILQKEPLGRLLVANSMPAYSALTLKRHAIAFLLPEFASSNLVVAMHSLDQTYTSYAVAQPTPLARTLRDEFNRVCAAGKAHTWHTVVRPDVNAPRAWKYDPNASHTAMPGAHVEYRGIWSSVSRVVACGAVCSHPEEKECTATNPTGAWFIVDDSPVNPKTEVALTAVSIVSAFALFLIVATLIVAYVSISAPLHHLTSLILNTMGDKQKRARQQHWVFHCTRCFWAGDLQALVRTFQLLSFCFRFNKKYVPQHVLEQQLRALRKRKDYLWRTIVVGIDSDEEKYEDEEEDNSDTGASDPVDMEAFVKTVSVAERAAAMGQLSKPQRLPTRESSMYGTTSPGTETCAEAGSVVAGHNGIDLGRSGMSLVESATVLVVRLCAVELAYFTNYRAALKPHRRIMNLLLGRIRRYRGELFEHSGDCIAAAWNAFESLADHTERAAACALSIARMLSVYREAGFRVGIVLHQGPFVCGVVEDNKEAFTTVFGTVPRQAMALAELASSLPYFSVLVSEPVKQSLASRYECIMVDVIKYHVEDNPIVMFELHEERRAPLVKGTPLASSAFAEEHARVFFDFRNHDFTRAMKGIGQLRTRFPGRGRRLLDRIEMLCKYYMQHANELPMPYFRSYPTWPIFEAIAYTEWPHEMCPQSSKDDLLSDALQIPRHPKSIYEDDTVNFRQELHDNVLASRRTHSSSPTTKAISHASPKTAGTGSKRSPLASSIARPTQSPPHSPARLELVKGTGGEAAQEECCAKPLGNAAAHWPHAEQTEHSVGVGSWRESDAVAEGELAYAGESVLSIHTPTNAFATASVSEAGSEAKGGESCGEDEDGTGRQRFSFTNRMGTAYKAGRSCSFVHGTDSFTSVNSETMGNAPTLSFGDIGGSFTKATSEIPTEIVAKNGITYLRSSRILGRGSFGCVYLGMDILSGRMVAIKFLPLPSEEEEIANVEREVVTMQQVKSNQVVEFISYAFNSNLIIIVMECMLAGSLQGILSAFGSIPGTTARLFIRDVLRGLHKLHASGVIHRDVKPQNVLLTLAGNCKISDFGASALLLELVRRQREGKGLQVLGTPVYLAPESARGTPEEKSDIWSCGIMFIQLLTGSLPYEKQFLEMPPEVLVFQIGSGAAKPIIPDTLDEFDAEFVGNCLKADPKERLSAQRLLELPLFAL